MAAQTKPADGEGYVGSLNPPLRDVASALRDLVLTAAPQLEEKIKYGAPHYDLKGTAGTLVYIMDAGDHVNLGFYDGVDLKDPKKLLEGTGKRLRHVKVRTPAEANNPALKALVKEAVAFRKQKV